MINPSIVFNCKIKHYEHEEAEINIDFGADKNQVLVEIEVFDNESRSSINNSRIKLTLSELKNIVKLGDNFCAARVVMEGAVNA